MSENYSYTEICRQTGHTDKSVKRYVTTFARVATLMCKGVTNIKEVSFYIGISERLAKDYQDLYHQYVNHEVFGVRVRELVNRTLARSGYLDPKKEMGGLV